MKKFVKISLISSSMIIFAYSYFSIVKNPQKNKEICSYYISIIENFKMQHGHYPKNLNNLNNPKQYSNPESDKCNYSLIGNKPEIYWNFGMFGIEGYDFNKKEYWQD